MLLNQFFSRSWKDTPLVAIDTETTGQYPLRAELCEIAAVKYHNGQIIDKFQSLLSVSEPMGAKVISIHGITNEMLAGAPVLDQVLPAFLNFLEGSLVVAHHAPFDLGFLTVEIEKREIDFPVLPVLCTSLVSRKVITESPNHRLQTLIEVLQLNRGQAHRALDDAQACLELALKCFDRISPSALVENLFHVQGEPFWWERFSLKALKAQEALSVLLQAHDAKVDIEIQYDGGSKPGVWRRLKPVGLVRSPEGDFFMGLEPEAEKAKRFYLSRVRSCRFV